MATPPPRKPRPRSPVEDGEVGETAQDVLIRHPLLSPGERRMVNMLRQHEDVLTPEAAAAMGRLLSAALSPMPIKASPTTAKEALNTMATEMLPQRKRQREEMDEAEQKRLDEEVEQRAAAVEAALMAQGAARAEARAQAGSPEPPPRMYRDFYGNLRAV
jgi:regulator of protease activity HflC (stomatin/prohibitin superfamily)